MTSPWETYDALIEDLPEDVRSGRKFGYVNLVLDYA